MVSLDAAIAGKVPVTLDLASMTRIAGLGLSSLAFRADDGVDLGLWEFGHGRGDCARHWGGGKVGVDGIRHGGQGQLYG